MDGPEKNTAKSSNSIRSESFGIGFSSDGSQPQNRAKKSYPCTVFLARMAFHPITRNIICPALKNFGGGMAVAGAVTDLLKESGPAVMWVGLGLFGATTLLTSALFYRTEYLGRHLAQSIGDAVAGIPLLTIDLCQSCTCPPHQRNYNPRQTTQRDVSVSEDIPAFNAKSSQPQSNRV